MTVCGSPNLATSDCLPLCISRSYIVELHNIYNPNYINSALTWVLPHGRPLHLAPQQRTNKCPTFSENSLLNFEQAAGPNKPRNPDEKKWVTPDKLYNVISKSVKRKPIPKCSIQTMFHVAAPQYSTREANSPRNCSSWSPIVRS